MSDKHVPSFLGNQLVLYPVPQGYDWNRAETLLEEGAI